jgi:hypothetical protein
MPNPKDTKEHPELTFGGCRAPTKEESDAMTKTTIDKLFKDPPSNTLFGVVTHYPGCHKAHIECANKKIEEVRSFLESNYWDCYCDGDGYDPQCGEHGDGKRWLESLGEK